MILYIIEYMHVVVCSILTDLGMKEKTIFEKCSELVFRKIHGLVDAASVVLFAIHRTPIKTLVSLH